MHAAASLGLSIPKLCATDSLKAFGSCRLCLVEIDGRRGTPASCTTLVESGMKIRTQTPRLAKLRRGVMELYISDHPLDCLTCPANGSPGSIWGTDVYTDDSPICTAAVHAGLITVRSGGTVTLEIRPGQSSYTGSLRNGVNSQSWGSWHGSYVFVR